MNFPPKAISVLLLVQCLFIGMGCSLTRNMLRMLGETELRSLTRHLPACASFVLSAGLWAFMIPLSWAAGVSLRSESHQSIPMTQAVDTKITLVLTIVTVCVWSYATLQAMDVTLGFHGPITVINHTD